MAKISNSKLEMYSTCPKKYEFRYVKNLKGDYTSTPLLFGVALDNALNYILEAIRDKKEWDKEKAQEVFLDIMRTWDGQNRLDFFKSELPAELQEDHDDGDPDTWETVWDTLCQRGLACIDVYIQEVLPLIDEVLVVQAPINVKNEFDDVFTGVVDFIAKLKDGRTVLFDNKSASAKYPKNKVVKSQQLSLYLEQFPEIEWAGYIVLIKNPAREKGLTFQVIIDKIPDETTADAYHRLETALNGIKEGKFEPNLKSCKKFGKECEYTMACKYGNYEGLIPAYEKKEKPDETKNETSTDKGGKG